QATTCTSFELSLPEGVSSTRCFLLPGAVSQGFRRRCHDPRCESDARPESPTRPLPAAQGAERSRKSPTAMRAARSRPEDPDPAAPGEVPGILLLPAEARDDRDDLP